MVLRQARQAGQVALPAPAACIIARQPRPPVPLSLVSAAPPAYPILRCGATPALPYQCTDAPGTATAAGCGGRLGWLGSVQSAQRKFGSRSIA